MTTNASVINPYQKFYAEDGITPLSGGSIAVYENGTTTLLSIYSDNGMTVPQDNPYNLDAGGAINGDIHFEGFATITPFDGPDGTGAEMPSFDDVSCFDQSNPFGLWDATVTYTDDRSASNIVQSPVDGNYYISLQDNNLNHEPSASPSWWSTFLTADQQLFTSSGTWTKAAGVNWVQVEVWGAGGGGGNGYNSAAAEIRGGGSGGGGGRYSIRLFKASDLAGTVSVTIGAGGAANGVGGNTSFGAHLIAYGGGPGVNGDNASAKAGGQPGGSLTNGSGLGGSTYGLTDDTESGSAGGIGAINAAAAGAGLRSLNGGTGGGGGGGLTAAGAVTAGQAGGSQTQGALTGGGGAGGAATGAGVAGSAGTGFQGGGGGGAGTAGGTGGAGGTAGGGGGGGAGSSGVANSVGGTGGNGYCRVRSW